jgi:hypothetical protein
LTDKEIWIEKRLSESSHSGNYQFDSNNIILIATLENRDRESQLLAIAHNPQSAMPQLAAIPFVIQISIANPRSRKPMAASASNRNGQNQ